MSEPIIYHADCREGMRGLADGSVNLILTSPPYHRCRDYGLGPDELGQEKDWRDYVARLVEHLRPGLRLLAPQGNLLLNVRQAVWTGPLQAALQEDGWTYQQTYCWRKPNAVPCGRMQRRPIEAWEPVYWFTAGPVGYFDEDANRVPYAPGTVRHGRVRFGSTERWSRGRTGSEPNPNGGHPRNVIAAAVGARSVGHRAVMPLPLARALVAAHCPEGGLVLDPFVGSGTTCIVAWELGRRSIGFDLSEVEGSARRWAR